MVDGLIFCISSLGWRENSAAILSTLITLIYTFLAGIDIIEHRSYISLNVGGRR